MTVWPRLGSAVAVIDDQERLLLGLRDKPPRDGRWVLPGGGVRSFESIREAAKREAREETGLDVRVLVVLGVWEVIEPPEEHRVVVVSSARAVGGRLEAGDDLRDARFWDRDQIGSLLRLTPLMRKILRDLGWLA